MNSSSNPKPHYISAIYDFSVDGWNAGFIDLDETSTIPPDALMVGLTVEVLEALTQTGTPGYFLIRCGGALILPPQLVANFTTNLVSDVMAPAKAYSTPSQLPITVASTSQLTAGKVNIIVKYFMSPE